MAFQVIIDGGAQAEILEAYVYYEEQVAGLGDRFLDALANCYDRINANPQYFGFISSKKVKTLRDIQVNGFPYVVIYDFDGVEVTVYKVHNSHKKSQFF